MLSRSAQGLYWMGRYLERAEHLCRLLRLQVETLVDRPVREINFGWSRIYASFNREPLGGGLDLTSSDDFTLADSYTLADDLTFEPANPDSVWNCIGFGRENARQMRHCISAEMWTCLNLTYLQLRPMGIQDIWKTSPENFYAETARAMDTFAGVAETTMYRDQGWHFMRVGRFIERVQLSVSLLDAQLAAGTPQDESLDADWGSLLRFYQAFDAYNRRYSVEVEPDHVLDLLATDVSLPGSLCCSLDGVAEELAAIAPSPGSPAADAAQRLAGRVCALVRYEWPDRQDRDAVLQQVGDHCRRLHDLVTAAYIDYSIDDAPIH